MERRNREWMVNSILKVDPLAEFCITALGNTGPRFFSSELPQRIVFEKGTGALIAETLREMKLTPRRLHVQAAPLGYCLEIMNMNNIHEWLAGVIDHWNEVREADPHWDSFVEFSFVDRNGQKVSVMRPDHHDLHWHTGSKYSGRFTTNCFEVWVEDMTARDITR